MKLALKIFLCIFLILGVTGCITTPEMVGRTPNPGDGKVVLSVGVVPKLRRLIEYTGYGISWRAVDRDFKGETSYAPKSLILPTGAFPFSDVDGEGSVHMLSLPPGQYEIYNYALQTVGSGVITTYRAPQQFSLRFTVRANEVTYVGRFLAQPASRSYMKEFPHGAGGFYYWLDRQVVDFSVVNNELLKSGQMKVSTWDGSPHQDIPGAIKYIMNTQTTK